MGDHRASIKIEFEFHGLKFKREFWINFSPSSECGCDPRICEFFKECAEKGYAEFDEELRDYERTQRETEERQQLAALKAKYEP